MPTYAFRCRTCDAGFEVTRSISDDSAAACPQGHTEASRVFTAVSIGGTVGGTAGAPEPAQGGCCGGGCCG